MTKDAELSWRDGGNRLRLRDQDTKQLILDVVIHDGTLKRWTIAALLRAVADGLQRQDGVHGGPTTPAEARQWLLRLSSEHPVVPSVTPSRRPLVIRW